MTPTDTRETFYVVDYDLPATNARRCFYRHIQKYLLDHQGSADAGWSTQSVVITGNREFADFVFAQASYVGRANMYEAKRIR